MNPFQFMATALTARPQHFIRTHSADPAETKTDRMRNYLREFGSASARTLADRAGLPRSALVSALLKADVENGAVYMREGYYYWDDDFDAEKQKRINEAASLLRANGYTITKAMQ